MEEQLQNDPPVGDLGGETCGGKPKPDPEAGFAWVCMDGVWTKVVV